jgi:hypothetical protein
MLRMHPRTLHPLPTSLHHVSSRLVAKGLARQFLEARKTRESPHSSPDSSRSSRRPGVLMCEKPREKGRNSQSDRPSTDRQEGLQRIRVDGAEIASGARGSAVVSNGSILDG